MMTRKHFEKLATAIRRVRAGYPHVEGGPDLRPLWAELVAELGAVCRDENPRFDSARFLAACEVQHPLERLMARGLYRELTGEEMDNGTHTT